MILENRRIFIVEDDPGNLAVTMTILRQAGAKIFFDRWGKDTLTSLRNALPIDLIVMDLMLPHGISGYDVFDTLRAEADLSAIPMVAVTAADPNSELSKVRRKGFEGYISKPIRYLAFAKQLARVIAGEQVWETN